MKRLLFGVLGLVIGYVGGAALGGLLVTSLSPNTHDKSVELATTALLMTGPAGALIGVLAGVVLGKTRPM